MALPSVQGNPPSSLLLYAGHQQQRLRDLEQLGRVKEFDLNNHFPHMVYAHPRNLGDLQIRDCHPTPPPHPNIRMCKCMCLVAQVSLSGNVSQALAYVRQKLVAEAFTFTNLV
jgi:hypothetical protein